MAFKMSSKQSQWDRAKVQRNDWYSSKQNQVGEIH